MTAVFGSRSRSYDPKKCIWFLMIGPPKVAPIWLFEYGSTRFR